MRWRGIRRQVASILTMVSVMTLPGCGMTPQSGITSFVYDDRIRIEIIDRHGRHRLEPFKGDSYDPKEYDHDLPAGRKIVIIATADTGKTISTALRPEGDMAYEVAAVIRPDDPTAMCMGCGTPVSTPMGSNDERLWLIVSFNGISSPIHF